MMRNNNLDLSKFRPVRVGEKQGDQELPAEEGRHPGPTVYWDDVAPVGITASKQTLTDLSKTHVLLHNGLLWQVLGRDPLALYWAEQSVKEPPIIAELGCALFTGEGVSPPFDRTLLACPLSVFEGVARHLARLAFVAKHGNRDVVWAATQQTLDILDPILARQLYIGRPEPMEPPTVPVLLYGLESDAGRYAWKTSGDLLRERVCLTFQKPLPPTPHKKRQ
jgi:hypothetical protein